MALAIASVALLGAPAHAQDATWLANPTVAGPVAGTFDFNANTNWNPATTPTGTATFGASNGTNVSFSSTTTNVGGFTLNAGASQYVFTTLTDTPFNNPVLNFNGTGIAINGGTVTINNNSTINFNNASTADRAAITNDAFLQFKNNSTASNAAITNNLEAIFFDRSTAGNSTVANNGEIIFANNSTAGNAVITDGNGPVMLVSFTDSSSAGNATITTGGQLALLAFANDSTGGNARLINETAGAVIDFSSSIGPNGDRKLSAGSIEGVGAIFLGGNQLTVGSNNLGTTFAGVISDCDGGLCNAPAAGGSIVKIGTGTLTLTGTNLYTGATIVNGGTLEVDGSIATSSAVTVNAGGMLTGLGTLASTTINAGGVLAPGNAANPTGTLSVAGNLAFASGAIYMVQISGMAASHANVTGTASLAGTVQANFAPGGAVSHQYDILHSAGLGGTTFTGVSANVPGFTAALGYGATDVFLTLNSQLGNGGRLNVNQQNVVNSINDFFNAGGLLPKGFLGLFALSGTPLASALTQVSGETATGSQQTTFDAMSQFMELLTDPFMNRGGGFGALSSGYADEALGYGGSSKKTDAFAMFTKAPPPFEQRWSVWAAGFGGSQSTSGNTAVGSSSTTSNIAATAIGADYLISPTTIAGFALAGGGTNFSVANGGAGRSDLFQMGAYIRHNSGPAYITAALAYGWQDITTNRTVTVAGSDQLRAEFNANAWSGRLEGGYRYVAPTFGGIGITPYAAAQFVTFNLPAYAEQVIVGTSNFALAYNAKDVTDPRTELGIRTDKSWALADGMLTLRGRFAWAHDYDPDRSIAATFQSLPGASFVVNGAAQAADSALTTASVEMRWKNGWSAAATFEGEFSNVTQSYAGKGVVRYVW